MANINQFDIELISNLNEKRVWAFIPEFFNRNPQYCGCKNCILDIAALALNSVVPCYQVGDEDIEAARRKVSDEDIYRAIVKAAEQVNKVPHHN